MNASLASFLATFEVMFLLPLEFELSGAESLEGLSVEGRATIHPMR